MAKVRLGAADRAAFVGLWRRSGLSLPAFCRQRGINLATMRGWVYKQAHRLAVEPSSAATHAEAVTDGPTTTPAFLPVRIVPPLAPAGPGVEVVLGSGWRIVVGPGFDSETLPRVVAVLEDRPC